MGADARNDIQWRKNWIARLTEAEQYYANYMKDPAPYSLVYSTDLRQDNINYQAETLDISGVTVYLILNNRSWFAIPANVINQIWQGLAATGRTKDWGLNWPAKSVSTGSAFVDQNGKFNVSVELLNDKKNVIGKQNVALSYRWWRGIYQDSGALVITPVEDSAINVTFSGVKADDITDRLNINIAGIDGVNAQTVAQNKRISIMPIDEYTKNDIVYKIGDKGPAGGIVFHDRGISINGWRYVEVAPKESEKKLSWYDAISYCQNLNIGGYTDWHLPDYSELNFMYQNLKTKGLGGFSDNWYWSSWELGANDSWRQRFSDGHQSNFSKSTTSSVRSVRAF
ncbi:MAG: DUF1566 domain-containing protein [Treponema sp.]|jgi:hypothetical protein|nr:DUF1566 domain-containing protein [Treponema sp.]